jgi:hypothetical protein
MSNPLAPVITSPVSRSISSGATEIISGTIPGSNFSSYKVEIGRGRTPASWTTVTTSSTQVINGTLATLDTSSLAEDIYIIRVIATDTGAKTYQYQVNDIYINNFNVSMTSPVYLANAGPTTIIYGTAETKNGVSFASYKIEWGAGIDPVSYSNSGVVLANGGTASVNGAYLGYWDSSSRTPNQYYTLKLTVSAVGGASASYINEIYLEPALPAPPPSPPAPTAKIGDLNGDNKVNIYDLSILLSKWKKSVSGGADLNGDHVVNIYDLSILLSKWGK